MPVNRRVAEFSLAQRHVIEIARELATDPKVLSLDEPTEPLQQADMRKLFGLIEELNATASVSSMSRIGCTRWTSWPTASR